MPKHEFFRDDWEALVDVSKKRAIIKAILKGVKDPEKILASIVNERYPTKPEVVGALRNAIAHYLTLDADILESEI